MSEELYTGLDIGSHSIRIAVGKAVPGSDGKEQIHIVGAVETSSSGVHKGTITNLEDAVSSVSKARGLGLVEVILSRKKAAG
jgi:cell division ATPase FtsA